MGSSNFRDPIGLAYRMLRSPNPTARSVLMREALNVTIKPLDRVLAPLERRRIARNGDGAAPAILVVGGPRSGTTIVYQTLARHLAVACTTNWVDGFARSPITAGRLRKRGTTNPRFTDQNYFGSVAGLDGPNDAFGVWNRWFGETRGRPESLSPDNAEAMRAFVATWYATFGRPLLNKNNRNSLCIQSIAEALPEAIFVVVGRDPLYVAQSLIESRAEVQGDKRFGWGLLARDAPATNPGSYIDAVCDQVVEFQRLIAHQANAVEARRVVQVDYEAFCKDPSSVVQAVQTAARIEGSTTCAALPLKHTNRVRLPEEEFNALRERMGDG